MEIQRLTWIITVKSIIAIRYFLVVFFGCFLFVQEASAQLKLIAEKPIDNCSLYHSRFNYAPYESMQIYADSGVTSNDSWEVTWELPYYSHTLADGEDEY